MDLLKNAIASVKVGVEDSGSNEHDRLLSAVRNIHAGILLLYKEKLRRLSPPNTGEVLLKSFIRPTTDPGGGVIFVGHGRKTVDVQQIRERFGGLGIVTDWKRFDRVNRVRTDVEHYYSTVSESQLRGLISDAFVLVRDFAVNELNENPRALLGEEVWQEMLDVSEVFESERRDCEQLLASVEWISDTLSEGVLALECETCRSPLLQPVPPSGREDEIELECRACGARVDAESFVPTAIALALGREMYLAHTDGNTTPYVACPNCSKEAYVIEEGRCALCEYEAEHTCASCGSTIPPEELDSSPLCGYCDHVMSKDD